MKPTRPTFLKYNGQNIPMEKSTFIIGNFPDFCDLCISNTEIAPLHCRFILDEETEKWRVEDMNTKNGTMLNGFPMAASVAAAVKNGDVISAAGEEFIFLQNLSLISADEADRLNSLYEMVLDSTEEAEREMLQDKIASVLFEKLAMIGKSVKEQETAEVKDMKTEPVMSKPSIKPAAEPEAAGWQHTPAAEPEAAGWQHTPAAEPEAAGWQYTQAAEPEAAGSQYTSVPEPEPEKRTQGAERPADRLKSRRIAIPVDKEPVSEFVYESRDSVRPGAAEKKAVKTEDTAETHEDETFDCVLEPADPDSAAIHVTRTPFWIGKSEEADYRLEKRGVSRDHACITRHSDGVFYIRDNDSTNGTSLNGKLITDQNVHRLKPGVRVSFYNYEFTVMNV